jgi:hypothetical protein
MDNIRHEFRKYAEFNKEVLYPAEMKKKEIEAKIRELLFKKYKRLADKLFIDDMPEIKTGRYKREDIEVNPYFLEIVNCASNPSDMSYTMFTFRVKYWITTGRAINEKGEEEDSVTEIERIVKPHIALRFFSNYIGDEDEEADC